ncbi:MAG: flippase-like domain-containing protein [Nitrospirales bacterium]|nr:flippase-like domain-containing protein [Nitrospirales bacterium]
MARAGRILVKTGLLALKLLVSASLIVFLLAKVERTTLLATLRQMEPAVFLAAIGISLVAAFLSTLRWKLLVPQPIGTGRLFSMYLIGSFFNNYLPGGVGGDAVKAYYLSKEMKRYGAEGRDSSFPPSLTGAIASVFMDRYVGLGALISLSVAAFPFGMHYLKNASMKWPVIWVIPLIALAFLLVSLLIFAFRVGERLRFLLHAYQYLQFYRSQTEALLKAFIYSLAIQLLGVLSVYLLSMGLHLSLSFLSLLVFLPMIILFSMIPVTVSGIGLREGAFVFLLGSAGIAPESAISLSLLWFFSVFVTGIWGLLEYLRYKAVFGREIP